MKKEENLKKLAAAVLYFNTNCWRLYRQGITYPTGTFLDEESQIHQVINFISRFNNEIEYIISEQERSLI